jgi:hypothetical protein
MTSSDVGVFGMNTPAYICIDEVSTDNLLSASFLSDAASKIDVHPNPARDRLYLDIPIKGNVSMMNMQGIVTWASLLEQGQHEISVASWPRGVYILSFNGKFASRISLE